MLSISRDSQPRPTFAASLIKLWSARYLHFAATGTANALLAFASAARQLAIVYRHCQPARGSRFPGSAPFLFLLPLVRPSPLSPLSPLRRRHPLSSRSPLGAHSCLYLPRRGRRPRDGKATSASTSVPSYALLPQLACFFLFLSLAIRGPDTKRRIVREDSNPANATAFKASLTHVTEGDADFTRTRTIKYCRRFANVSAMF